MVSTRPLPGEPTLIFVTVGTSPFSFVRLFSSIDRVLNTLDYQGEIIVQSGSTHYTWRNKNAKTHVGLSPMEMQRYFRKSSHIIAHGGFGTIYIATKTTSTMPLFIARKMQFHEHVDDHQVHFFTYIQSHIPQTYSQYFDTSDELTRSIAAYLTTSPHQNNVLNKYIFKGNKDRIIGQMQTYFRKLNHN